MFADADEDIIVVNRSVCKLSTAEAIRLFADYCQWCQFIPFLGPMVSAIGSL